MTANETRLNLAQAIRSYWAFLLPSPFVVPLMFVTFAHMSEGPAILLAGLEFFVGGAFCYWPYLRGRVNKSYATAVGLLLASGAIVPGLFQAALGRLLSR